MKNWARASGRGPSAGRANRARALLVAVWLVAGFCRLSPAAQVIAQVDRSVVTLGDGVTLTIVFDGLQVRQAPSLPPIPNFRYDSSQVSQQFYNLNGAIRQAFGFVLAPTIDGDLVIPELSFAVGGQTYRTKPIPVKVIKPGSSVPGPTPNAPTAFVTVSVARTDVYAGELFLIEERLYAAPPNRLALLQPNWNVFQDNFRLTPINGYTETDVVTNNRAYKLRTYQTLATPLRTGTFSSGPVSLVMAFGRVDPFFSRFQAEEVHRLAADPITLRVLPVPTNNAPATFSGAVGTYSLTAHAAPTNVTVGDPITVKVRIAGRGRFESLSLPAQPDWRDFKTYPPSSVIVTNDRIGLDCAKTFEQVVIPQNHEVKMLPPFVFSFFDPAAKVFRTLRGPAIGLKVRPGGGANVPPPTLAGLTNRQEAGGKRPELVSLKVHLGVASPVGAPLFRQSWFLLLQLVPPGLWLGLLVRRRYREALSRNPRLRRQRAVARLTAEGLQKLRQHAAERQSDEFFALVFHLLQEQIGERLDMPASAITEAVVEERLRPRGADADLLARLHQLFQECNLARYAPVQSRGELDALIPRVESVLELLRQLPPEEGA